MAFLKASRSARQFEGCFSGESSFLGGGGFLLFFFKYGRAYYWLLTSRTTSAGTEF
eukprot:CAMPEP_0170485636 /NCGR_PEP_ID=MMETSP0208-20121228/4862_1 /TAXON_ID=197538 /ORGANISM="Strombidium inclinatum, Strain S3" /LENGTH=55 /DNA_ID=CAMNT_0010759345 /DNA_START=1493 /DNA_END=1660 /DNA_ORIENTATION=-